MLLLGIDLGTSSVKVSVINAATQVCIVSTSYPDNEVEIIAEQNGWAEQSADLWWENVKQAIIKCNALQLYNPLDIAAIGIAYQMHGLVLIDKDKHVLRNAIIWCDSRAVSIGEQATNKIGEQECLTTLLNHVGNFTASKLAWVKNNEPHIYEKVDKIMLPGDFIAMKMSDEITTTATALSEGMFWDFKNNAIATIVTEHFGFAKTLFPSIHDVFSIHGHLKESTANRLGLKKGIPISYKAGDQPNNALSLNVLKAGEVAATAGTSGVVYGVNEHASFDAQSRINCFAHVNHLTQETPISIGTLLCINGTGIFNKWVKNIVGNQASYSYLNNLASEVPVGSNGLLAFPFGNGAERMLNNRQIGASFEGLNFNIHQSAHLARAVQEGIAFSFRYGLEIMHENGIQPAVIRASKANLFLSNIFATTFCNVNNVNIEYYTGDGSFGAAIGAGVGAKIYDTSKEAMGNRKPIDIVEPASNRDLYNEKYLEWKYYLNQKLINKEK